MRRAVSQVKSNLALIPELCASPARNVAVRPLGDSFSPGREDAAEGAGVLQVGVFGTCQHASLMGSWTPAVQADAEPRLSQVKVAVGGGPACWVQVALPHPGRVVFMGPGSNEELLDDPVAI